jgi:hypothetical protein
LARSENTFRLKLILAPIVRHNPDNSDDDEREPSRIAGFRAAYVFDVSQTIEYSEDIAPARGTSYGRRIALGHGSFPRN